MRIKVDKNFTCGFQMEQVKKDIADFKDRYTEYDVMSAIRAQADFWEGLNCTVLKFEAAAFPGGTYYGNVTHFMFDIVLDAEYAMFKIHATVDMELDTIGKALIFKYAAVESR